MNINYQFTSSPFPYLYPVSAPDEILENLYKLAWMSTIRRVLYQTRDHNPSAINRVKHDLPTLNGLNNHTVFVKTGLNALETRYFIIIYKIIYFLAKINHLTCGG